MVDAGDDAARIASICEAYCAKGRGCEDSLDADECTDECEAPIDIDLGDLGVDIDIGATCGVVAGRPAYCSTQ